MEGSYSINHIPIFDWGLKAGVINTRLQGYALGGAWSLPKRVGSTHYDWTGDVEPYVDSNDIALAGRDLTLSLVCTASLATELRAKLDVFSAEIPDWFTLSHKKLGEFEVGLLSIDIQTHGDSWAALTLKLCEPQPTLGATLPVQDNGAHGIDGYSWTQLGFVAKTIDNRYGATAWQPLSVTTNPAVDSWMPGYRAPRTITIQGTIRGADYADFAAKVGVLQTLLAAEGVRRITHFDGSAFDAFCVDGFEITDLCNFHPTHFGKFTCKMITT